MKAPFFNYAYWKFNDKANTLLPKNYSFVTEGMDDDEVGSIIYNTDTFVVDVTGEATWKPAGFHGWEYEISIFENPYSEAIQIDYGEGGTISNDTQNEFFTFGISVNPEELVRQNVPASKLDIPIKVKRKIELYFPNSGVVTERSRLHHYTIDWNPLENISLQKQAEPAAFSIDGVIVKRNGDVIDPRTMLFSQGDSVEVEVIASGESLQYQWFVENEEVAGEDESQYDFTMGIKDVPIKVEVTDGTSSGFRVVRILAIGRSVITDIFASSGLSPNTSLHYTNKMLLRQPHIIWIREQFPWGEWTRRTIKYNWYKDGDKIVDRGASQYFIISATGDDAGVYYCKGVNERGEEFDLSPEVELEMASPGVAEIIFLPSETTRRILFDFNKELNPVEFPEITLQDLINDPEIEITDPIPNGRILTPQSDPDFDDLEYETVIINKNATINFTFGTGAFAVQDGVYTSEYNYTNRNNWTMYDYINEETVILNVTEDDNIFGDIVVENNILHMEFGYGLFYTKWRNIVDRWPIVSPGAGATAISHLYRLNGVVDTYLDCVITVGYSPDIKSYYLTASVKRRWN